MTIYYSPFYGSRPYVDLQARKGCLFDSLVTGTAGLLAEMELRAGLSCKEVPDYKRIVDYYLAIKASLAGCPDPIFRSSFDKDELGVVGELLRWRDALIMNGWNPGQTVSDDSHAYKFRDLARVEPFFHTPGEADRWRALQECPGVLQGVKVEVPASRSALETVVAEALDVSGADVHYLPEDEGGELSIAAKIRVLDFRNRSEGFRWLCGQKLEKGTVVVNADNKALNDVLRGMGKAPVASEYKDSNPLTLQLFKLGFGLFDGTVDIRTLFAYLSAPVCPVGFEARKALRDFLTDTGGLGSGWNELLAQHKITSPALVAASAPPARPDIGDVRAYNKELKTWANKYAFMLDQNGDQADLSAQLHALKDLCNALDTVLDAVGSLPDYETLHRYVDGIYGACDFPGEDARLGSVDIVRDIRSVVDAPEHLIWLDCNAEAARKYPLFFLSEAEKAFLRDAGVHFMEEETFSRSASLSLTYTLSRVRKEITLVMAHRAHGERMDEHPLFTEIKARGLEYTLENHPELPSGESLDVTPLTPPPYEYALEKGLALPEREHGESYNSINTLIQRPTDYVLDYIVGLPERDLQQLSDLNTVKGNVAHEVIERLARESKDSGKADWTDDDLNAVIQETAVSRGMLLYANKIAFDSFRLKLIESVRALFSILAAQQLTLFDCEHYVEVTLPDIGRFNARIDMVLQDKAGDFVIFDLKWSQSGVYPEKIKKQEDLQLELYRKALEVAYPGQKILGSGYYVIPQCAVETHDGYFRGWKHVHFTEIAQADRVDVWQLAVNSCKFRKEQLSKGILEGGEGRQLDPEKMAYLRSPDSLYPLEEEYRKKGFKADAYGGKNFILKGRSL